MDEKGEELHKACLNAGDIFACMSAVDQYWNHLYESPTIIPAGVLWADGYLWKSVHGLKHNEKIPGVTDGDLKTLSAKQWEINFACEKVLGMKLALKWNAAIK